MRKGAGRAPISKPQTTTGFPLVSRTIPKHITSPSTTAANAWAQSSRLTAPASPSGSLISRSASTATGSSRAMRSITSSSDGRLCLSRADEHARSRFGGARTRDCRPRAPGDGSARRFPPSSSLPSGRRGLIAVVSLAISDPYRGPQGRMRRSGDAGDPTTTPEPPRRNSPHDSGLRRPRRRCSRGDSLRNEPPYCWPTWLGSGWPPTKGTQGKRGVKASLSDRDPDPLSGEGEGAEAEVCLVETTASLTRARAKGTRPWT